MTRITISKSGLLVIFVVIAVLVFIDLSKLGRHKIKCYDIVPQGQPSKYIICVQNP